MATGVGLRQISLTPLNLQTPKNPCLVQELGTYLPQKLRYIKFSAKIFTFSLPWQPGRSAVSANNTAGFAAIENPLRGARIRNISPIEAQL